MYVKTLSAGDDVYAGDEGAPDLVDLVHGGAGNDDLSGGQGDDTLNGEGDNDLLNGGAGNDILDGGAGDDTAVFSGAAGDYVWSGDSHAATITGPDGTDTLIDVEHLKFGSTIVNLPAPNAAPSAPSDGDAAANIVSEGAVNGTAVAGLTLSATDADAGQTLTWSLLDDAGGRFAIDAATGVVTVADATKLNFETAASHQISVQVSDGTAVSSASFTIEVANVAPTSPADSDVAANTVAEGAASGTVVAGLTIAASDPNSAVTYSLSDDAGGRFSIDAATGVVAVADASKLNFEAATSHQITVRASDGTATSSTSFTIAVADVAMAAPADTNTAANTVSEAAANGAVVSGLTVVAADPNGGVTYSLVDDAGGRFAINAATGAVTVANASLLDHEAAASHQITVRASDGTATADTTVTIDVANAPPSVPTDANTAANTVSEDTVNGTLVGITALASEPKTGTVSYSLSNDAGGRFAIDATTGVVTVADASKLNFEAAASHQITVRATDGLGAFSSRNFTIAVTNVANGAPQDTDTAANTISEGAVNGDAVSGLTLQTPDINGGPLVYSLLDDAGGRFAINAATGVVTVANANLLNFEAATSHQIVVQAASGTESANTAFTIDVFNAAPVAPYDSNAAANTVPEAARNGWVMGITMAAPDPHGGTVTYSLTNNAGGAFAINPTTGVVTVVNGGLLDHDTQSTHTITVQASDGVLTSSSDVVITLIDQLDSTWIGTTAANTYAVSDVQDWQLEGLAGNDTLTGGVGDDIIVGGTGDDILAGGAGNDIFYVAVGDGIDTFDGGAGYDTIKASSDNATITIKSMTGIEAFALNNFIYVNIAGTSAADTLDFTGVTIPWTPTISMGAGNDTVYGTAGADYIKGDAGLDDLRGGAGNDTLDGGADADALNGGDGNDTLIGGAGNDTMAGGNGDDVFQLGAGVGLDTFDGGAGYDTIQATADNVVITLNASPVAVEAFSSGGFANVSIAGTTVADDLNFTTVVSMGGLVINGLAGDDAIRGSDNAANVDVINGGAGNDALWGQAGNDILDGGDGADGIDGGDGADTITGGIGNDTMAGGAGDDVFLIGPSAGLDSFEGGAGFDTIRATANNTAIGYSWMAGIEVISNGGFTNVSVVGTSGNDDMSFVGVQTAGVVLSAGAGDDWFTGSDNADNMRGDAGGDWIFGLAGADTIDGGDGADAINGGDGNDTVIGGAGNDNLGGGNGDDVFLIGVGAGVDSFDGGAGYDTIQASAANVVIGIASVGFPLAGIEAFSSGGFANVTIGGTSIADDLNFTNIVSTGGLLITGLGGDDIITGSNTASNVDNISGGTGNDTIYGQAGNDVLDGGDGVDAISGGDGNDTITGGTGNDSLAGGNGDDVFLIGLSAGSDVFDGGAGFDEIRAAASNAVIGVTNYNAFPGVESFSDGGFTNVTIAGTSGADDLNFANVVVSAGIAINGLGGDDSMVGSNNAAYVDILNGGAGNDTIVAQAGDDLLDGGDGADNVNGGDGVDTITGGAGNDTLIGGNGDDVFLVGVGAGNDIYDGGAGSDTVRASAANAVIGIGNYRAVAGIETFSSGGFANVTIAGGTGADDLDFSTVVSTGGLAINLLAGDDVMTGSNTASNIDIINGGAGNDTIYGQAGDDVLDGGDGVDTLNGGDGNDTITGGTGNDTLAGGNGDDVFLIGAGAGSDAFDGGAGFDEIRAAANNVIFSFSSLTGIEAISAGGFTGVTIAGTTGADNLNFQGVQIGGLAINAGNSDDVVTGTNDADVINGGSGNDTIYGLDGADLIDGGAGVDNLFGGAGDDTFLVAADYAGAVDNFDGGAGVDTIQATANNVAIGVAAMNAVEVFSSGGFSNVTVAGSNAADTLDFTGKTFVGSIVLSGLAGNDAITGSAGADIIKGDAGADTLNGGDGNDVMDGGADNDVLLGGAGDDVLLVAQGIDSFDGGAGFDELRAGGVNVVIRWSSLSGVEKISGGGFANVQIAPDVGTLPWTFDFTSYQLEGIALISGGLAADNITGSGGDDRIYGANGADILIGGYGDDVFTYTGPNGQFDTVDGGAGWDKLVATAAGGAIEVASMTSIEEISSGGFAGITFASSNFADTVDLRNIVVSGITQFTLNGGNDVFYGTAGADTVDGGTGDDVIETGDGDDIIRLSFNNGMDVIHGGAGYDKIIHSGGGAINIAYNFDGIEEIQGSVVSFTTIIATAGDDIMDMRGLVLNNIRAVDGAAGNDVIYGSSGADRIVGGDGLDELFGEDGDDQFVFGQLDAADVVHGGGGYDTLVGNVLISVTAFDGIEAILGSDSSNYGVKVFGTEAANTFDLTNVTTTNVYYFSLLGGDDTFIGSAAGEYIFSGVGADTLTGAGGADKFAYWLTQEAVGDVIVDFTVGEDKIDLSLIDAVPVGAFSAYGDQAFTFLGTGNFTSVQGQLRYTVVSDGVIVYGDATGDGVADFDIKVLGVSSLAASDFVL